MIPGVAGCARPIGNPQKWAGLNLPGTRRCVRMTEAKRGYRRSADELAKLADLHAWGIITDAEFQRGKVQILG